MKLTRIALALAALPAFAYSTAASAGMNDIIAADNQVGIQVTDMNLDYTETGDGINIASGTLDTENGDVYGFNLTYSSLANWFLGNDYLAVQYGQNKGSTAYVGQYITSTPLVNNYGTVHATSSAKTTDYSLRYGRGYALRDKAMVIPYLEIGSHEWKRGVNEGETYKHSYYGIGAMFQFSPANRFVLTLDGLVGRTKSASIDVAGIIPYTGTLGSSTLTRIGATADYAFTKRVHGMVGVDYTQYKYGMSSPDWTGTFEPDSKTKTTMYRVGIGYAF